MAHRQRRNIKTIAAQEQSAYTIQRRNRYWEVLDPAGELVCLTVYRRGAEEVIRRLRT